MNDPKIDIIRPQGLTHDQNIRRVVLLCHGLNNSPNTLDDICETLATEDTLIVRLTLSGHRSESQLHNRLWLKEWLEDLKNAADQAKTLAAPTQAEVQFVGFSLSCLIFLVLLTEIEENSFSKAIFFAPPLRSNGKMELLKCLGLLRIPFLPSLNRKNLRVHKWLPFTMYQALFDAISIIESTNPEKWKFPALIMMDPRDRLVSFELIRKWIHEKHKKEWSIMPILMETRWTPWQPFHTIFDKRSTGNSSWQLVSKLTRDFLCEK